MNNQMVTAAMHGTPQEVAAAQVGGIDEPDAYGQTALMVASAYGNLPVVQHLLTNNANPNYSVEGWSPLAEAALWGHTEVIRALLEYKADIENQSADGTTPLLLAAGDGHADAVKLLLEKGANVSAQTRDGMSAFSRALSGGHFDIAKELLRAGYNPVSAADRAAIRSSTEVDPEQTNQVLNESGWQKRKALLTMRKGIRKGAPGFDEKGEYLDDSEGGRRSHRSRTTKSTRTTRRRRMRPIGPKHTKRR